jgi:amino acid efflux transporter
VFVIAMVMLGVLAAGGASASTFVRATSACFILVYVLALGSATRITSGAVRACAAGAFVLICVVAVFSSWYLLVPAAVTLVTLGLRYTAARHVQGLLSLREEAGVRQSPVALDGGDEAPLRP